MKKYRVWHTDKKICSKFDTKEKTEVEAKNLADARAKVKAMFPTHRVSACWLIEKWGVIMDWYSGGYYNPIEDNWEELEAMEEENERLNQLEKEQKKSA